VWRAAVICLATVCLTTWAGICLAHDIWAQDVPIDGTGNARDQSTMVLVFVDDVGLPVAHVSFRIEVRPDRPDRPDRPELLRADADGRFALPEGRGVGSAEFVVLIDDPAYASTRHVIAPEADQPEMIVRVSWRTDGRVSTTRAHEGRTESAASSTLIHSEAMRSVPARNTEELLRLVPGLTLVQHGSEGKGHQFFLRGFDASHGADLEITLEGVPLNEWSNVHAQGYLDLGIVIPELVSTFDVVKGPFALDQGPFAMAGSIDVRLGAPDDARGLRSSYSVGTTGRHRVFLGYAPQEPREEGLVGVAATLDEGYGEHRSLRALGAQGRTTIARWDGGRRVALHVAANHAAFDLPGTVRNQDVADGIVGLRGAYDTRGGGTASRGLVSLAYRRRATNVETDALVFGGTRWLSLRENFTGYLLFPDAGDLRAQSHQAWGLGGRVVHRWRVHPRLVVHAGSGIRGESVSQSERFVDVPDARAALTREAGGVQVAMHALTAVGWSITERIDALVGIRLHGFAVGVSDKIEATRGRGVHVAAAPRARVHVALARAAQLFVSYGRGVRPPELLAYTGYEAERVGVSEDVDTTTRPRMTVSDAIELGVRWAPHEKVETRVSGFVTWIERESIFDHVSGTSIALRGTRRVGVECELRVSPWPWLDVSADLTLVDARFVTSGNPIPFAPHRLAGARATLRHPTGWRAGLRGWIISPRRLTHGARGSTWAALDATLGFHARRIHVDVAVENVLNLELREGEYHYASHWRREAPLDRLPALHTTAGPPLNARLTLTVFLSRPRAEP